MDAMIGQRLLHYQVLEKLGEGGMGVVYKARDTHLDRFVAIKVLPPARVADPGRKARFVQEAKAASALNHPNIITIHDISHAEGIDFIVMEYVPGKTLDQAIPRKGMRLNEALKYAVEIADALAAAHGAGIVHRDLKPGNVMVSEQGRIKVLDFGLAKLAEAIPSGEDASTETVKPRTEEGAILGTVAYMSPEQAQSLHLDGRSDIFSFGSMLYEMVTGRRPFQADSRMSTLAAILNKDPAPLAGETPHDLEKLIARCLRKDPARRFQTMADLKVSLEELKEESDSGKLSPVTPVARTRRNLTWTAAVVVVATVALTAAWLWLRPGRTLPPVAALTPVPLTSFAGSETSPSFSPDGTQVAFAWNGEKQDNWDIYVKVIGMEKPLRLTSDPSHETFPVWSPDGRWIVFTRRLTQDRAGYFLIPPLGGPERKLAEISHQVGYFGAAPSAPYYCWSPDSRWLVMMLRDAPKDVSSLFALPVEGGERRRLTSPGAGIDGDSAPALSPDGRTLVFSRFAHSGLANLYALSLSPDWQPGGEPRKLTSENAVVYCPAWTADGEEVTFVKASTGAGTLWRLSPFSAQPPRQLPFAGQDAAFPAISRVGDRLAFVRRLSDTNIWSLGLSGTGVVEREPVKFIASTQIEMVPEYSPDGSRIAYQSTRSGANEIWVCRSDGSNPVRLTSFNGPQTGLPKWSPDGQRITFFSGAAGSRDIYVVDAGGGPSKRLTSEPVDEAGPSWSRDGKWIYFHSRRAGEPLYQIRKVPSSGGEVVDVTRNGGTHARESSDGRALFFRNGESLWKLPIASGLPAGPETQVLDSLDRSNYVVLEDGIYFCTPPDSTGASAIRYYSFANRATRTIATIRRPLSWGFAVSPDRRTLLFAQIDEAESDLMLVENFR